MIPCRLLLLCIAASVCMNGYCTPPPEWMTTQIQSDLAPLKPEDLTDETLRAQMQKKCPFIALVQISQGKVTIFARRLNSCSRSRAQIIRDFLGKVLEKHSVTDCKFLINLSDGIGNQWEVDGPIFCFSKRCDLQNAILFPDPETIETGEAFRLQSIDGSNRFRWNQKIEKGFWRGTTSGQVFTASNYLEAPRVQLVMHSIAHPELLDARFSSLRQGAENLEQIFYLLKGNYVSVYESLRFKYQILVDGNTCSWSRGYWQLFSNSVMIKQDSDYILWYYNALKPHVHYIPVKHDFSNLVDVLQWAKKNDETVHDIVKNARDFAQNNLMFDHMIDYTYNLLLQYSEIQGKLRTLCEQESALPAD